MPVNSFPDTSLDLLKRSLDAYTLRQRIIAENVANTETPGYGARSVAFEELLQNARAGSAQIQPQKANGRHIGRPQESLPLPEIRDSSPRAMDNGVNDVSVDMEMAALAETNLNHKMATRILAMRYQLLRTSIRGRG